MKVEQKKFEEISILIIHSIGKSVKGRDFWVTTYMKSFVLQFSDYQSMISNLMGRKRITMVFEGNNVKIHDTGTPPINNAVRIRGISILGEVRNVEI